MRLERLFPASPDNRYRGHPVALWVFGLLTLIATGRSLVHIFAPDGGAQSIATIPLDRMTSGGAEAVVFMFAMWGLSQILMAGVAWIVLLRYRALVPLMYVFLIAEYLGRLAIGQFKHVETVGTAPGATANLILPGVGLVMLILALRGGRDSRSAG